MTTSKNSIYREMVVDLLYRLRLVDELFCQTTDAVISAMNAEDVAAKRQAVQQIRSYSSALQVIYADFLRLIEGQHVVFPADVSLWQWEEPNGGELIAQVLERLHGIEEGMEGKLDEEMSNMEAEK